MRLASDRSWFHYVRFRLIFIYLLISLFALTAVFSVTFLTVRRDALCQMDRELERNTRYFTESYFHAVSENRISPLNKQLLLSTDNILTCRVEHIQQEFARESAECGRNRLYLMLVSSNGVVLSQSPLPEALSAAMRAFSRKHYADVFYETGNGTPVAVRMTSHMLTDGNRMIIGINRSEVDGRLRRLFLVLSISLLLILLIAILAGVFFAPFVTRSAEQAFSSLERTAYAIAHDLRTPVTRLRGHAELILNKDITNVFAGDVAEESEAMLETINTLLGIDASARRAHNVKAEPLDLPEVVKRALEIYMQGAEEKKIRLVSELPQTPVLCRCRRSDIQQLLGNLLDNALKFTPEEGCVTVRLKKKRGRILLQVTDTGIGIPKDDLPHVFERFYRVDSSRTMPGNGLGLSLVKAIVSSLGGTVTIESECGHGTTVCATFRA